MNPRRDHVQRVIEQWRQEMPGVDRSAFAVVGRVSRLAQVLTSEIERVFNAHGVTAGEFDVLAALRRIGRPYRLTPSELSRALIVSSGGMAKRLKTLEARGLIRRETGEGDGRSRPASLTAHGRRLVDEIVPEHIENERRLLAGLSAADRVALARLLERLAVSLDDVDRSPRKPTWRGSGRERFEHGVPAGRARR